MDSSKVLVVDSDSGAKEAYDEFIRSEPYETSFFNDVPSALKQFSTNVPDLVVADVAELADIGLLCDVVNRLSVPVIWASRFNGLAFEELPLQGRVLNKPFRSVDLRFAVRSCLKNYGLASDSV